MNDIRRDNDTQIVNIGNSTQMLSIVAGIVIAILGVVGYLIYVGGWNHHHGDAKPPAPVVAPE